MIGLGVIASAAVVWAVFALIGGIYELSAVESSPFNTLFQFNIFRFQEQDLLFFSIQFPTFNGEWFSSVGQLLSLNFALFDGWANYVRIFSPIGIVMIMVASGLVITLFQAFLGRR